MEQYFVWNGVDSREMGLLVETAPPIVLPAERVEQLIVPGRAGHLLRTQGEAVYDSYLKTLTVANRRTGDAREIGAWLRGAGTLLLSTEPGFAYNARVVKEAQLERWHQHIYRGTVSFLCQPLKRQDPQEPDITAAIETNAASGTVTGYNPGDVTAKPLFTITGSGTISLTGETGLIVIEIPELATGCRVDTASEHVTTLDMSENLGEHVTFQGDGIRSLWIPRGAFSVEWSGAITALTLTPRWRWL